MEIADPFFSVQEEVAKSLATLRGLHEQLHQSPCKNESRLTEDLRGQIRQTMRNIEWDLEDLQETVGIVERNPSRFKLTEEDVSSRRTFLGEVRSVLKSVKDNLANPHDLGAIINFEVTHAKPPKLANGGRPNAPRLTDSKAGLLDIAATKSNKPANSQKTLSQHHSASVNGSMTDDPLADQHRLLREQDDRLDQLGNSISTLKSMSNRIGGELEEHIVLLDDFSEEMAHTGSKLDNATKRVARLLHLSTERRQWCAIGWLSLILFIIVILLVVL